MRGAIVEGCESGPRSPSAVEHGAGQPIGSRPLSPPTPPAETTPGGGGGGALPGTWGGGGAGAICALRPRAPARDGSWAVSTGGCCMEGSDEEAKPCTGSDGAKPELRDAGGGNMLVSDAGSELESAAEVGGRTCGSPIWSGCNPPGSSGVSSELASGPVRKPGSAAPPEAGSVLVSDPPGSGREAKGSLERLHATPPGGHMDSREVVGTSPVGISMLPRLNGFAGEAVAGTASKPPNPPSEAPTPEKASGGCPLPTIMMAGSSFWSFTPEEEARTRSARSLVEGSGWSPAPSERSAAGKSSGTDSDSVGGGLATGLPSRFRAAPRPRPRLDTAASPKVSASRFPRRSRPSRLPLPRPLVRSRDAGAFTAAGSVDTSGSAADGGAMGFGGSGSGAGAGAARCADQSLVCPHAFVVGCLALTNVFIAVGSASSGTWRREG